MNFRLGEPFSMTISELVDKVENGPVTLEHGRVVSYEEACRIMELDPVIKRFGTWAVTEYGVECLTSHYAIPKDRLGEMDWDRHMIGKTWTVAADVCDALEYAREHFKKGLRRAPKLSAPGRSAPRSQARKNIPNRIRFAVMKRDGYKCQLCGKSAQHGYQMHIDHKVARSKGGSDEIDNLWVLCSVCNNGKGTDDLQ